MLLCCWNWIYCEPNWGDWSLCPLVSCCCCCSCWCWFWCWCCCWWWWWWRFTQLEYYFHGREWEGSEVSCSLFSLSLSLFYLHDTDLVIWKRDLAGSQLECLFTVDQGCGSSYFPHPHRNIFCVSSQLGHTKWVEKQLLNCLSVNLCVPLNLMQRMSPVTVKKKFPSHLLIGRNNLIAIHNFLSPSYFAFPVKLCNKRWHKRHATTCIIDSLGFSFPKTESKAAGEWKTHTHTHKWEEAEHSLHFFVGPFSYFTWAGISRWRNRE